ncbi:hypothetical protein NOVO_05330 [Rickettsiales bacterium Ac37b]|nr:hypothetical protein NOVO_05330 [Rickettsiales bacterium Ac37b]
MDISIINDCKSLSLMGKISFPETIIKLTNSGVERYIIDLVGLNALYYGINGETYLSTIEYATQTVSTDFNTPIIKNTIADIQQHKINYITFLNCIIKAGCCHYEVFLKGKKVIYFGRDGSHHIEPFIS